MNRGTCLVLSGGGTKGAFEIGAWKAMIEKNISIDCVIGTSIGAINAALIAQGDYDTACRLWTTIDIQKVFKLNSVMNARYAGHRPGLSFDQFRLAFLRDLFHGGLDTTPLRELMDRCLDEEKIRASKTRLGLVTVELDRLNPVEIMIDDIPEGKLNDYLMASAALPVFHRQKIDGKTYLDGGFYDNRPVNFAADAGYRDIIAVDFPALGFKKRIKTEDIRLRVISNSEYLGLTLEFDRDTIQKNIEMGYLDALKALDCVEGRTYYVDPEGSHVFYDRLTDSFAEPIPPGKSRKQIAALLGIADTAPQKEAIGAILRLIRRTNYGRQPNNMLSMLEITARCIGVKRLALYSADGLILEILNALEAQIKSNFDLLNHQERIIERIARADEDDRPSTPKEFTAFYFLFLGNKIELPTKLINRIARMLTPEFTLGLVVLTKIHELLSESSGE